MTPAAQATRPDGRSVGAASTDWGGLVYVSLGVCLFSTSPVLTRLAAGSGVPGT